MRKIDRKRVEPDPEKFVPLTPVVFEVLLALGDGDRHGYAIMREVEERTGGSVRLRAGSLYRALGRLLEDGLVAEVAESADEPGSDARRRYYTLTRLGRKVAEAEARRLSSAVEAARAKRLLTERAT
jgi:DNA-binding PadR family transcriptional regulator